MSALGIRPGQACAVMLGAGQCMLSRLTTGRIAAPTQRTCRPSSCTQRANVCLLLMVCCIRRMPVI